MSKSVTDKICKRLLNSTHSQAAAPSVALWGEAVIPECMKKTAAIKKHPQK